MWNVLALKTTDLSWQGQFLFDPETTTVELGRGCGGEGRSRQRQSAALKYSTCAHITCNPFPSMAAFVEFESCYDCTVTMLVCQCMYQATKTWHLHSMLHLLVGPTCAWPACKYNLCHQLRGTCTVHKLE